MSVRVRAPRLPQQESEAMSICSTAVSDEARKGMKPLAVPVKTACTLVGVGNTTMWALIKAGRVKTVSIGPPRLVI